MNDTERHERAHLGLERLQTKADRVWQAAYNKAKSQRVRAYRQSANRASRSQRTTLYYGWLNHVTHDHGAHVGTFPSLADLKARHAELHGDPS